MSPGWFYLLFPQLYLQQVLSHYPPEQAAEPLALLSHDGGRHIWQCNRAAQTAGVERDMPLTTALCLCPGLNLLRADTTLQQQTLQALAAWASQFSAFISVDAPQGMWMEAASMLRLFHGADELANRIQQSAASEGWQLQLGAGQTPLAARMRAHLQWPFDPGNQDLSRLTLLQMQDALPLNDGEIYQLQRLGIHNLQDIRRLPMSGLDTRIGAGFSERIRRLLGQQAHPLPVFEFPETFEQRAHFISEVEYSNGLLFPLQRLLGRLTEFLQRRQLSTRQLQIQLSHRNLPDTHWQIQFAHGEYQHNQLIYMVRHFLEQKRLPAPVQSLRLQVHEFIQREHHQPGLLNRETASLNEQDSGQLLNRLSARLEPQQLSRLQIEADPRPEQASQLRPLSDEIRPAQMRPDTGPRPLWILTDPLPCQPPENIISGPERICSGWWDEQPVRRDYYIMQQQQQLLWVFRSPEGWFVHGVFS